MPNWDTSIWIAVIALGISALSLVVSVGAVWVNHRGSVHTRKVYEQERRESFKKQHKALLEVINTHRRTFDRTRVEIETLKAIFDAEPPPVRALLSNYSSLFSECLPKVEGVVRQARALWNEVAEWDQSSGMSALIHHEARYRALLHEDQIVNDHALNLISVFKEKLEKAQG